MGKCALGAYAVDPEDHWHLDDPYPTDPQVAQATYTFAPIGPGTVYAMDHLKPDDFDFRGYLKAPSSLRKTPTIYPAGTVVVHGEHRVAHSNPSKSRTGHTRLFMNGRVAL